MVQLLDGDLAESDRADLALVSEGDQLGQLIVEIDDLVAGRHNPWALVETAKVHDRQALDVEAAEVGLDACS